MERSWGLSLLLTLMITACGGSTASDPSLPAEAEPEGGGPSQSVGRVTGGGEPVAPVTPGTPGADGDGGSSGAAVLNPVASQSSSATGGGVNQPGASNTPEPAGGNPATPGSGGRGGSPGGTGPGAAGAGGDANAPTGTPLGSEAGFFAIDGASANDIWAVGETVAHWDGTSWTLNEPPVQAEWRHVAVASDGRAWIAEGYVGEREPVESLLYHWTGSAWEKWPLSEIFVDSPTPTIVGNYQPESLVVDGQGQLWLGLAYAETPTNNSMLPPPQDRLASWSSGAWYLADVFHPAIVGADGMAYIYGGGVGFRRAPTWQRMGNCPSLGLASAALVVDGIGTILGHVALAAESGATVYEEDLSVCDVEIPEQSPEAPIDGVVTKLRVTEELFQGAVPRNPGTWQLVSTGSTVYLIGGDALRRSSPTAAWEHLDWAPFLREAWGETNDDGWFVGPDGIFHWDGVGLERVQ